MNDKPRRVPEEDNDSEGSTEHLAKLVAPDASSEKEVARLEHERIADLERQMLAMRTAQTERDRRIAQLTDQLVQKGALLEGAEANAAGAKRRAGLEQRELQVKLGELLLSYNQAEANAAEVKRHARLELRELQAKLDESLRSRDNALEQAEANAAEEKKRAGLELRELQAKLDESLLSRDHTLEQAQSALQKASCVAEANEQSQRELTEMRAELEASKSESAAFRLRLADTENGCANSKADADAHRTQTATGLVNTDEDPVVHRLMERMQAMEAEMASRRWNDKSFEMMECRNEG
jgi:DNA repair exonuclease SbcCD ATPase subunit